MPIQVVALGFVLATAAWGQQNVKLTARELFYLPPPAAQQAAQPAEPKPPTPTKPPKPKPVKPKPVKPKPKPATPPNPLETQKEPPPQTQTPKTDPAVAQTDPTLLPEGAKVIRAEYTRVPLGLRYSLLKRAGDRYEEVDTDTVFRAGDSIRLSVEANDRAYLYLVIRGSSGTWKVLFPSAEIGGGSNVVERDRQFQAPSGGRFTFDEQAGVERLFLVLSRKPEPDLDGLIYSLVPGAAPVETERKGKQVLLAQNTAGIDDSIVNRIRNNFQARDLVFEKVDEKSSGERREKAVYIVNPDRNPDARLIADISLKHE